MYRTRKSELRYKAKQKDQTSCPFCNLTNRQIIEEKERFYIVENIFNYDIWDRRKVEKHLLIVPKEHIVAFREISRSAESQYLQILKEYSERGFDSFTRATDSITKTQPHFHTHLIKTKGNKLNIINFNGDPYFLYFK